MARYTYLVVIRDDGDHIARQLLEGSLDACVNIAKTIAEYTPHNVFVERVDDNYSRKIVWPKKEV